MSTKMSKGEKELTQRIEKLESRWKQEQWDSDKARAKADLTHGVIEELKDTLCAMREVKDQRKPRAKSARAEAEASKSGE
ncbi:MAG: hypothetical protein V1755_08370 [Chloroflexota bacterium]